MRWVDEAEADEVPGDFEGSAMRRAWFAYSQEDFKKEAKMLRSVVALVATATLAVGSLTVASPASLATTPSPSVQSIQPEPLQKAAKVQVQELHRAEQGLPLRRWQELREASHFRDIGDETQALENLVQEDCRLPFRAGP